MTDAMEGPSGGSRPGMPGAPVLATLERAAELRGAGRRDEAAGLLQTTLTAERAASDQGDLPGRMQLALQLADLYLEAGEPERARELLEAEATVVEAASRELEGAPEQKRILTRGLVALRDRAVQVTLIGRPAPVFEARAWVLGRPWSFDELRGRVVLMEFWATWCRPCLGMFPKLQELHGRYAERGLAVLALTRLYSPVPRTPEAEAQELDLIRKVVQDRGLEYSVGVLEDDRLQRAYGASGFPTVALVDRDGIVRYARFGGAERLAELFEACLER